MLPQASSLQSQATAYKPTLATTAPLQPPHLILPPRQPYPPPAISPSLTPATSAFAKSSPSLLNLPPSHPSPAWAKSRQPPSHSQPPPLSPTARARSRPLYP